MEKDNKNKKSKKKNKNGIWLGETADISIQSQERIEKIQSAIENIIFYGITVPMQLFQTVGVFAIAYFNHAFAELSFFLIGFFFTRAFLGATFHLNSTVTCTTVTWTIFYLVTAFIPSLYISVFLCILLGTMLATYMHYIVVKDDEQCPKE